MHLIHQLITELPQRADSELVAFNPNIRPNDDAIPGIPALRDLLGGVLSFCLFASMGALIVSLLIWGWGRMSSSPQRIDSGKSATAWSLGAFIGFGMINTITSWAWGVGQGIPLPGAG
ncbi:hypothetical protein G1H11_16145 [Phytoactinopolyspora alkaliphila]|uniref:Conjugal transfer protein TrbC n=1 Tax=Phytoactinopolyspora alkaliphila TaxID=1783498 RepID=A0A6N9YPR5_9ACTN|nr:hypothetical protein [Phytoactinopolyspora alkaliphila]NED96838.1 hypothetical protein [Phytoactinopolyspora alkaliphila]